MNITVLAACLMAVSGLGFAGEKLGLPEIPTLKSEDGWQLKTEGQLSDIAFDDVLVGYNQQDKSWNLKVSLSLPISHYEKRRPHPDGSPEMECDVLKNTDADGSQSVVALECNEDPAHWDSGKLRWAVKVGKKWHWARQHGEDEFKLLSVNVVNAVTHETVLKFTLDTTDGLKELTIKMR